MTNPPPDKDKVLLDALRRAQRADTTTRGRALRQASALRTWARPGKCWTWSRK
jgi:hypothetical protein